MLFFYACFINNVVLNGIMEYNSDYEIYIFRHKITYIRGSDMIKQTKAVIGVMPLYDDEKDSIWMLQGYFDALKAAGAIPVMLPLHLEENEFEQIKGFFDGWLFTGGHDVNPKVYCEKVSEKCGTFNDDRDKLERMVFNSAMAEDKPVLGICRGIQIINAFMGGTLYQDLDSERKSSVEHHMVPPYDRKQHSVSIVNNTPLFDLLNKDEIGVNSYHHQAIKKLSNGLQAMAVSEDGLVEAVYSPDKSFLWAVQWHPEFSYMTDDNSMKILNSFAKACKGEK